MIKKLKKHLKILIASFLILKSDFIIQFFLLLELYSLLLTFSFTNFMFYFNPL